MSAWIVSKTHIDLLIEAGLTFVHPGSQLTWSKAADPADWDPRKLDHQSANAVGRMLWGECVKSVKFRYPGEDVDTLPGPGDMTKSSVSRYRFANVPGSIDPVVVLAEINCYEYQSCEHPGWKTSEAKRFLDALTGACVRRLPGYDKAPWGFDDRDYFLIHGKF